MFPTGPGWTRSLVITYVGGFKASVYLSGIRRACTIAIAICGRPLPQGFWRHKDDIAKNYAVVELTLFRLPHLALLPGNVFSYVATTSDPVTSGFWDWLCASDPRASATGIEQEYFLELPGSGVAPQNSGVALMPPP